MLQKEAAVNKHYQYAVVTKRDIILVLPFPTMNRYAEKPTRTVNSVREKKFSSKRNMEVKSMKILPIVY